MNDHESGIELCEWAVGMYVVSSKTSWKITKGQWEVVNWKTDNTVAKKRNKLK